MDAESVHGEVRAAWEAAEAALARNDQAMEPPTPEETRWLLSLGRCETVKLSKNNIKLAEDGTPLVVNEKGEVRGWLIPPYPPELVEDNTD